MIVYVRHLEKGLLHTDCSLSRSCYQDVHPWCDQAKPSPAHILYYTLDTLANRNRPWLSLNWFVQVSKNKHKCLLNSLYLHFKVKPFQKVVQPLYLFPIHLFPLSLNLFLSAFAPSTSQTILLRFPMLRNSLCMVQYDSEPKYS